MLKKYWLNTLCFCSMVIALSSGQLEAVPYMQLSSSNDQLASSSTENVATVVIMGKQDAISGMGWDAKKNEISVQEDGIYFLMLTAQVGAKETATNITRGGHIYIWFEVNGVAAEDGGNWIFASPTARAKTIVNQMVLPLKTGDVLRYKFFSSTAQFGLLTYPATNMMPASPGVTFTMYKVGE